MSEQFTKETWRPGKRRRSRPRKRAWGGQRKAGAAFLAMARLVGLASGTQRMCTHCGTQPAMRGLDVCRAHGGAGLRSRWHGDYVPGRRSWPKPEPAPDGEAPA